MGTTGQPISSDTNLVFNCNNGKIMFEYQQLNFLNLDFVQFLSFYGQRSVYLLIQFVLENVKLLLLSETNAGLKNDIKTTRLEIPKRKVWYI